MWACWNSFDGPKENKRYAEPALPLHGSVNRYDHRDGNDDSTQAGNLFR
jgi:catalase